jgi:glycosyltransferase involved in cell wall biosynthesis
MAADALVSAIVIFRDAARFLDEAVASVAAQSYPHWELLLVDDGSTDASTAMARRHAAAHPDRVRYLEHPGHANRGMSASRNLGVASARGPYVAFLDADDVWLPAKLAEQVSLLDTQPAAAMLYGRTLIWHGWTGRDADVARDHTLDLGVPADTLVAPPTLFLVLLRNEAQSPTTCNALIRRDVVTRVGGFEESFRGLYEDQAFFFKIELAFPVYVAGACWARYRQHEASCSADTSGEDYWAARRPLLEWLAGYLAAQGVAADAAVARAVQRQFWRARHPAVQRVLEAPARLAAQMRGMMRAAVRGVVRES